MPRAFSLVVVSIDHCTASSGIRCTRHSLRSTRFSFDLPSTVSCVVSTQRALVRNRQERAGEQLALAPAERDPGDGFVAPRLALGDQVADHRDGNQQHDCEHGGDRRLDGRR
jgi:hypothetical protein